MSSVAGLEIEKLYPAHDINGFDCGNEELNRFLCSYALQNQRSNSSITYVVHRSNKVVGYYTLSVGAVSHEDSPIRIARGMPKYPIPIMILARLAVDQNEQGQGLGKGLLKDALRRTVQAADIAGIRCLVVHAKDDAARNWYEQFDFDPSPTDPLHLFLLVKDIKKALSGE